jgi:hypothetical protein
MSRIQELIAIIQEQDRIINDCETQRRSDPFGLNIKQNNALLIQQRQAESIRFNANTELQKEMIKSTGQTKDIETKDYIIGIASNVQRIADNTEKEAPDLPKNDNLEKLTQGNNPPLRKWNNGKYKCNSLERFIKAYIKIADNLTPDLIRDFLVKENGTPYTNKTIEQSIKTHGAGKKIKSK